MEGVTKVTMLIFFPREMRLEEVELLYDREAQQSATKLLCSFWKLIDLEVLGGIELR